MIEVVIPAHNAAPFLRETLESVAAQTRPPALVTVVDDRSTDGTVAVAEAAAAALRDRIAIRVLRNAGPQGPSGGRNTAIRSSGATWIALLDSDDLFVPDHHARLAGLLEAAPDAVLAFGDNTLFRGAETLVPSLLAESGVAALPAEELAPGCLTLGERMFAELTRTGVFCTSACLFRRDAALAAGLFDEAMMYSEDQDFFLRLALQGRFVFSPAVVTRKRVHETNLSQARNALRFCRGTSETLARLAAGEEVLSPAQRAAVQRMLPQALSGYLYHASRSGPAAYWRAARLALRSGHGAMAARPRHLLRTALHRVLPRLG
ncbi:glycosyltransferase family A protein [Paracraurococcus ruber]|nr:glycosyltransferase family A protein [Paracraurococcus ruber]